MRPRPRVVADQKAHRSHPTGAWDRQRAARLRLCDQRGQALQRVTDLEEADHGDVDREVGQRVAGAAGRDGEDEDGRASAPSRSASASASYGCGSGADRRERGGLQLVAELRTLDELTRAGFATSSPVSTSMLPRSNTSSGEPVTFVPS